MLYKRMPIEIEAPEGFGYENIDCNLSESSFTDQRLSDLGINIHDLLLVYGDHTGEPLKVHLFLPPQYLTDFSS